MLTNFSVYLTVSPKRRLLRHKRSGSNIPYCPKCGTLVGEDATFCSNCGNAIGGQRLTTSPLPGPSLPQSVPSLSASKEYGEKVCQLWFTLRHYWFIHYTRDILFGGDNSRNICREKGNWGLKPRVIHRGFGNHMYACGDIFCSPTLSRDFIPS